MHDTEVLEGYAVDLACLRKWRQDEVPERARSHTRVCALEGHCIESGYGLVGADGSIRLLDASATPLVIEAVRASSSEEELWLRASRRPEGDQMKTFAVEEVARRR